MKESKKYAYCGTALNVNFPRQPSKIYLKFPHKVDDAVRQVMCEFDHYQLRAIRSRSNRNQPKNIPAKHFFHSEGRNYLHTGKVLSDFIRMR